MFIIHIILCSFESINYFYSMKLVRVGMHLYIYFNLSVFLVEVRLLTLPKISSYISI